MQIMKDPNFKDPTGNFSPAAFQQALQSIGMTEQGYLASQRERNLRRQILSTVGKVANTPDVLVDALNTLQRRDAHAALSCWCRQSPPVPVGDPTDDDLKRYYDNHHSTFTQPEYPQGRRSRRHAGDREGSGEDHRRRHQGCLRGRARIQLGTPEKRHVQQIPFPDSPLPTPPIRRFSPAPTSRRSPRSKA